MIDDIKITPLLLLFVGIKESSVRVGISASHQKPATSVELHMFMDPARKKNDDLISCRL